MIDTRMWWYISFSDDDIFQGAMFVTGDSFEMEIEEAIRCGALRRWHPLCANITGFPLPPEEARGCLLSLPTLRSLFPDEELIAISNYDDEPTVMVRGEDT